MKEGNIVRYILAPPLFKSQAPLFKSQGSPFFKLHKLDNTKYKTPLNT